MTIFAGEVGKLLGGGGQEILGVFWVGGGKEKGRGEEKKLHSLAEAVWSEVFGPSSSSSSSSSSSDSFSPFFSLYFDSGKREARCWSYTLSSPTPLSPPSLSPSSSLKVIPHGNPLEGVVSSNYIYQVDVTLPFVSGVDVGVGVGVGGLGFPPLHSDKFLYQTLLSSLSQQITTSLSSSLLKIDGKLVVDMNTPLAPPPSTPSLSSSSSSNKKSQQKGKKKGGGGKGKEKGKEESTEKTEIPQHQLSFLSLSLPFGNSPSSYQPQQQQQPQQPQHFLHIKGGVEGNIVHWAYDSPSSLLPLVHNDLLSTLSLRLSLISEEEEEEEEEEEVEEQQQQQKKQQQQQQLGYQLPKRVFFQTTPSSSPSPTPTSSQPSSISSLWLSDHQFPYEPTKDVLSRLGDLFPPPLSPSSFHFLCREKPKYDALTFTLSSSASPSSSPLPSSSSPSSSSPSPSSPSSPSSLSPSSSSLFDFWWVIVIIALILGVAFVSF